MLKLTTLIDIRDDKHHVYAKRQTRICSTWPSSSFTCRLLLIISSHKWFVSSNFLSTTIFWAVFICSFSWQILNLSWIWLLLFAEYVKHLLINFPTRSALVLVSRENLLAGRLQNSPYFSVFKYAREARHALPISLLILRKNRLFCSLTRRLHSNLIVNPHF